MSASAAKCPTLIGRENVVSGEEHPPFGRRLEAVPGRAEKRNAPGEAGKEAAQALRYQAKDFFASGAGMKDAAQFADLSDLGGLPPGIFEQAANSLMRRGELLLRGVALDDF